MPLPLVVALLCLGISPVAGATPDLPDSVAVSQPDTDFPRLPTVSTPAPVAWPPDAVAELGEGEVLLMVDVAEDGHVISALATETSDPRLSQPAEDALRAYRFLPARDDQGNAAQARIMYRVRMTAPTAPPLLITGALQLDDEPAADLLISALGPNGAEAWATTDADGRFRFAGLADGDWTLTATSPQGALTTISVPVTSDTLKEISLELRTETRSAFADDTLEVTAVRAGAHVTEHRLVSSQIAVLPGTSGDVVRAVQNLPGIARPPLNIGQLIIRGTPPESSRFMLDGGRIPTVFHFSGLTTVLSAESVSEVRYMPGNYGVRYGRALGGLVDLRTDGEIPKESRSVASIDVYQAQAFTLQRLNPRTAVSVAARRSYVDALLSPLLSNSDRTVRAPRYYDGQIRLLRETSSGGRLDAMVLGSVDRFRVVGNDAAETPEVAIGLATSFARMRLRWEHPLADDRISETTLTAGPDAQVFEQDGDEGAFERTIGGSLRQEFRQELSADRSTGWRTGLDLECGHDSFLYDVGSFSPYEEGEANWCAPAPYADISVRTGKVTWTPGLRADFLLLDNGSRLSALDPRASARWVVTDDVALKFGTGRFSQMPTSRQLIPEGDGNPNLTAQHSWQSTAGVEYQLLSTLNVGLTGFANVLNDLVVGREDHFRFFSGPPPIGPFDTAGYANAGSGLVYGAEGLLRYDDGVTIGMLNATWSRSERTGRDGQTRLFAYDQPWVVNALASRALKRGWRLGSRLRYGSGNPYTPVEQRVFSLDDRAWQPVYGDRDSARLPAFFAADLRVDKTWELRRWDLTAYLDVQGIAPRPNTEVMAWTWDYSETDPVEGIPPLPAFGFKGVW